MASKRQSKLANRYSKALIRAFLSGSPTISDSQKSSLQSMVVALDQIAMAIQQDEKIAAFFQSPTVKDSVKENVLSNVLESLDVEKMVSSFVFSVLRNGRLGLLSQIVEAFSNEVRNVLSILAVKVTTARELSTQEKNEIASLISSNVKNELELEWVVDNSILGGIVLEYEGRRYDSSILGKLNTLQEQIR